MSKEQNQKLFVVHGWTYNLDKWQPIVPLLKAQGVEPVFLKVPGLTTPSDKVWDIDGYVSWLEKELKGEKLPIVLAHSNGGRIAMAYLQKHPGSFKQLILMDSAGVVHNDFPRRVKLSTLRAMSRAGKPLGKIPGVRKGVYKVIGAQDYNQAPPNMRETMQNMLAANQLIDPAKVTVPTTLIWGSDDTQTPIRDAYKLQQAIAGSELFVVNGARHAPQFTNPEEVADIISKCLKTSKAN